MQSVPVTYTISPPPVYQAWQDEGDTGAREAFKVRNESGNLPTGSVAEKPLQTPYLTNVLFLDQQNEKEVIYVALSLPFHIVSGMTYL